MRKLLRLKSATSRSFRRRPSNERDRGSLVVMSSARRELLSEKAHGNRIGLLIIWGVIPFGINGFLRMTLYGPMGSGKLP